MALKTAKRLKGTEVFYTNQSYAKDVKVVVGAPKEFEQQSPSYQTPGGGHVKPLDLPWPVVPKELQDPDKEYSVLGRDMSTVTADEAKGDRCPGCNSPRYQHVEGCKICSDCGYSPCH